MSDDAKTAIQPHDAVVSRFLQHYGAPSRTEAAAVLNAAVEAGMTHDRCIAPGMSDYCSLRAGHEGPHRWPLDELRTEVERLREQMSDECRYRDELIARLHAERDRYREAESEAVREADRYMEALEDVLYLIEDSNGTPRGDNAVEIRDLVVAALYGDR